MSFFCCKRNFMCYQQKSILLIIVTSKWVHSQGFLSSLKLVVVQNKSPRTGLVSSVPPPKAQGLHSITSPLLHHPRSLDHPPPVFIKTATLKLIHQSLFKLFKIKEKETFYFHVIVGMTIFVRSCERLELIVCPFTVYDIFIFKLSFLRFRNGRKINKTSNQRPSISSL